MNLKPFGDWIVCRRCAPSATAGGIHIPDKFRSRDLAEVIAVGPGRRATETGALIPTTVKPGDKILFTAGAGFEVRLEGEDFHMVREEAVLGVSK